MIVLLLVGTVLAKVYESAYIERQTGVAVPWWQVHRVRIELPANSTEAKVKVIP